MRIIILGLLTALVGSTSILADDTHLPQKAEVSFNSYSEEVLVPIDVDGIQIFVPTMVEQKELRINYGAAGDVYFDEKNMQTLTMSYGFQSDRKLPSVGGTYQRNPTLFVAITGTSFAGDVGNNTDPWSETVGTGAPEAIKKFNGEQSQYVYGEVSWDTKASNRGQAKKVANKINEFLAARNQAWDVVLIGYSRGGILAHELSTYLKPQSKLRRLHVLLLDATAATVWNDKWPYGKASNVTVGVNYDDDKTFVPADLSTGGTISDRTIPGYVRRHFTPEGCGGQAFNSSCSHMAFPVSFVADHRFPDFLNEVYAQKDVGSFAMEDVPHDFSWKIHASSEHLYADLGAEIRNNTFYNHGYIATVIAFDVMIGAGGVGSGYAIPLLGGAQTSITKDGIAGSVNFGLLTGTNGNITGAITVNGAATSIGIFGVSTYGSFGKGQTGGIVAATGLGGEKVEMAFGEDGHVVALRIGNIASFVITNDDVLQPVRDLGQGFKDIAQVSQEVGGQVAAAVSYVTNQIASEVGGRLPKITVKLPHW